jgi:hypothetical protein
MVTASVKARGGGGAVWVGVFGLAVAACAVVFAANVWLGEVASSNAWGLGYGIAAAALLLGCAAYGARRRTMRLSSRLGRARGWLYFHTYAGLVFLLLVLMHSGFGLPSGWVTWGLWILSIWIALGGLLGLLLQRWIPRRLTSGLSIEVNYERIPELVDEARTRAESLVESCGDSVRAFYERSLSRSFARPRWRWLYFVDITGGRAPRLREVAYLAERLSGEEGEKLEQLRQLYSSKLDMDAHYTLQSALRAWLWIHLPVSIALVALLLVHLFSVLYY